MYKLNLIRMLALTSYVQEIQEVEELQYRETEGTLFYRAIDLI